MVNTITTCMLFIYFIFFFPNGAVVSSFPAEDRCRRFEFRCANTKCIPQTLQCNGADDCGDNSDENCVKDHFLCSNNVLVPKSKMCDGQNDCSDDEDPKICESQKCSSEEFICRTKPMNCINKNKVCNNVNDCGDDSDESPEACEMAKKPITVKCDEKQHFRCANNKLCISLIYYCDKKPDCLDQSDEMNCPDSKVPVVPEVNQVKNSTNSSICRPNEFFCGVDSTTTCISKDWVCDGSFDCDGTHKDEEQCPNFRCSPNKPNKCETSDTCYEIEKHCDGFADCKDKSDEKSCKTPDAEVTCHPVDEFKCVKNNTCIAYSRVCDNKNDCGDFSDERPGGDTKNCKLNACAKNNGDCEQICLNLYYTHKCICKPGFKIDPNNPSKCIDIDECAETFTCSHKCINTEGSFKCECFEGYQKSSDNLQSCLAVGEKFLLFSTMNSIRELRLWRQYMEMLYSPPDKKSTFLPVGIDFDYKNKRIFWTQFEPTPEIIQIHHSFSKPEQKQQVSLVNNRIHSPVGLAFDWINGLLYWTDIYFNEISVVNVTTGIRRVLLKLDNSSKVRSIVVHPRYRRIYWTDWGKNPKIECMGMDGNDRKVIVSDGLVAPNGLALDYIFNDLYWIDAKARNINAFNLKTGKRREVKSHLNAYGFDIDVFEDWIYLSDWHNEKIIQIHKKTGQEKILVTSPKPMGVKLFHQLAQPDNIDSVCQNHPCQYLCLPSSLNLENNIKFRCVCPDFSELLKDGKSCSPISPEYSSKITFRSDLSNKVLTRTQLNVHFVVGFVTTIVLIVLLVVVVFGIAMYRNYIRKVIKRATNFNNPSYHKTSNLEIQLLHSYPLLMEQYDVHSSELLPRNQSDDGLQMVVGT